MATKKTVTKTLPASNNLTLAQPRGMSQDEIEKLAIKVVSTMGSLCTKLKTLKPEIDAIKGFFNHHKRGEVLVMGCSSFEQFCTEKLGRTRQAVYFMLGEKKETKEGEDKKEKKEGEDKKEKKDKARLLSIEQQERLIDVGTIASRGLEARKEGKQVEAIQYDHELDILVHATPLDPIMRSWEPSYKAIVLDMLSQFKLNNYESGAVKQHCEAVEERLQGFKSKALDMRDLVEEVQARLGGIGLQTAMDVIAEAMAALPGCEVSDPESYDTIFAKCIELFAARKIAEAIGREAAGDAATNIDAAEETNTAEETEEDEPVPAE